MARWTVGAARDLRLVERASWDGDAAKGRIFAWAGFDGDSPRPAKARRGFLIYNAEAPELRGSYKLPFADVVDGTLVAIDAGLRASASRLPQTDAPGDVLRRARGVLDAYFGGKALADDTLVVFGGAVKALGDGRVGGHLVLFGNSEEPDLQQDFFDAETDFGPHRITQVFYHHGLDPRFGGRVLDDGAALKADDLGIWIEAQLKLRDEYERAVYDLVEAGKLGWSSGTAPHLVEREAVGGAYHIARWPLGLDASLSPVPVEPRAAAIPLKSLVVSALKWPEAQPEGDGESPAGAARARARVARADTELLFIRLTEV